MVLRYGKSCQEVCGTNLWVGLWTTQQLFKVSTPCIDDHQFKKEDLKSVGELSNACSEIVLECVYLARIGRLEILLSVNKLARPIIKWTKTCDKRLTRLISYIHFTSEYKQYCHVGKYSTTVSIGTVSKPWRFKTNFRWNTLHIWKSHICSNKLDVQEGDMCLTQFNRIWDYIFRFANGRNSRARSLGYSSEHGATRRSAKHQRREWTHSVTRRIQNHVEVSNVDSVSSNVNSSHEGAMLFIFEDNEAVIKMIIKGRSPSLRHIWKTHRVALDSLFDRINLDPKIQIRFAESKIQLKTLSPKDISHVMNRTTFSF